MSFRRFRGAGTVAVAVLTTSLLVGVLPGRSAGAADPVDEAAAADAVTWLIAQQEPDGGFELANFPGFETPDAVLAIASAAQTGTTWSEEEALAAIEALAHDPIAALDAWVASGINAGEASKLLLLVVAPLGLDPTDFGPSHHDLAQRVYPSGCGAPPDTSGMFFLEKMYVAFGGEVLCGAPDAAILTAIRDAQRPEGGWNYNGSTAPVIPDDPFDPNQPDIDSTALAVQALVAGGAGWDDPAIGDALAYLAGAQSASGAFPSFGSDDPNATAVAMLAIAAAGFDPNASCWRDTAVPGTTGTPYARPAAWIRSQQEGDGRIASPNDGYGVNSFATAQSVEGLLSAWVPVARATGAPTCPEVVSEDPAAGDPAAGDPAADGSAADGSAVEGTAVAAPSPSDPVVVAPRFTG